MAHWPPSHSGGLAWHQEQPLERKQKPLGIPALGMPMPEPTRSSAVAPGVDLGAFALFCSAEEVPVASRSCVPRDQDVSVVGRGGWSIRKTQSQELCCEGAAAGAWTEGRQPGKTLAWLDPPQQEGQKLTQDIFSSK